MKQLIKKASEIAEYHKELARLTLVDYSDVNFHLRYYPNLYEKCDLDGLQEFLFTQTVHGPLYKLFSFIQTERKLIVDSQSLGNEFMITDDAVMEFVNYCNPTASRLLLESITVPTSVYTDLYNAIMNKDGNALKKAASNHDLSKLYKTIGYLVALRIELIGPEAACNSEIGLTNDLVLYGFRTFSTLNELNFYDCQSVSFEEAKCITQDMIGDFYYDNYSLYTRFELDSIWKTKSDNIAFKKYYDSISKKTKFGNVPLSVSQKQNAKSSPNLICGVVGLAETLGCGKNTAQKILNKGILQKEKIAYRAGKGWRINRTKLSEFIALNPNTFKF